MNSKKVTQLYFTEEEMLIALALYTEYVVGDADMATNIQMNSMMIDTVKNDKGEIEFMLTVGDDRPVVNEEDLKNIDEAMEKNSEPDKVIFDVDECGGESCCCKKEKKS